MSDITNAGSHDKGPYLLVTTHSPCIFLSFHNNTLPPTYGHIALHSQISFPATGSITAIIRNAPVESLQI